MTREEIISSNPLRNYLEERGVKLRGAGPKCTSNRCPEQEHKSLHLCVSVDFQQQLWRCNDCGTGGSVIDWEMREKSISVKEAISNLAGDAPESTGNAPRRHSEPEKVPTPQTGGKIAQIYSYQDATGAEVFQVCRMEPKTFRQRHRKNGQWVWSMEGILKVLYRLPEILKMDYVWVVEGEKDADTLAALGICATCNAGGAGKWEQSYSEALRGKDVILCGDNDEPGQKHVEKVQQALANYARSTCIVKVPGDFKDVSEWSAEFGENQDFLYALVSLAEDAEPLVRGHRLPIRSMEELERDYAKFVATVQTQTLNFAAWLPSTVGHIRPIVPGEVVAFLAGTGVGKTALLQNLAIHTTLKTLLFEMELPGTLSFERFAAMATGRSGQAVFDAYHHRADVAWKETGKLSHIYVCSESRVTIAEIERIVTHAGLKTGSRPVLVMVDYVQLIAGKGERYDRISDAMEGLKIMAKACNVIVVLASQISRKKEGDQDSEVYLCDAKESGSIENSSGLVIGAWRDSGEKGKMSLKILKNTKGVSGKKIPCRIGEGLLISEEP